MAYPDKAIQAPRVRQISNFVFPLMDTPLCVKQKGDVAKLTTFLASIGIEEDVHDISNSDDLANDQQHFGKKFGAKVICVDRWLSTTTPPSPDRFREWMAVGALPNSAWVGLGGANAFVPIKGGK